MSNSSTKESWVSIYFNEECYFIHTISRYNLRVLDYKMPIYHFSKEVDTRELGKTIFLALDNSRIIDINTPEDIFSRDGVSLAYQKWIDDGKKICKSKNRKSFLLKMMLCHICREGDHIIITPTLHKKLETWTGDGFTEDDYIVLSDSVSDEELGEAIKEVLSRCRSVVK
ncbi:CdiI family contact-dependent growth inhibition immunity protein [Providencia huaxiensis]|uniref:contact-dependent growth inhibition system immunity protein n=1 Tax=Providencia TaxID=586 RepID=UPI0019D2823A|nr:contact-dependent growth inhibition system immunity protein [Providencia sp. PROV201]MBN6362967.1 CdiI family contact-dependent growth inhibition immunity protein [Providencia huaxiensis]